MQDHTTAAANAEAPFRYQFVAMTTHCELQFYGVDKSVAQTLAQAIQPRVQQLELRYNFHAAGSWLNTTVNNRRSPRVALCAEAAAVLAVVAQHGHATGGAFDITVGTLAAQLRLAKTPADVKAVRKRLEAYTGCARWWLEGQTLCFDNAHTRLDLGGVIKEHAVDVAAQMARDAGVPAGLVNFGGDLVAFGNKPGDKPGTRFVAAVPNPLAPGQRLFALDLQDQALTTSAHYARSRSLKNGARHMTLSHVVGVDPTDAHWLSASVVSRSALLSGIYSTALLVRTDVTLPPDVMAVVVDPAGQVSTLQGAINELCCEVA